MSLNTEISAKISKLQNSQLMLTSWRAGGAHRGADAGSGTGAGAAAAAQAVTAHGWRRRAGQPLTQTAFWKGGA